MFGTAEFSAPEVVAFDEIGFYTGMILFQNIQKIPCHW